MHTHPKSRRRCAAYFCIATALVVITCCAPVRRDDGVFSVAIPGDPGTLDPHHSATYAPAFLLSFAYEGLIARGSEADPRPGLASTWQSTPRSVTFTLRRDISCADGETLAPADVAANFRYIADPANASPLHGSGVPAGAIISSDDNAHTVTVETPRPSSFLVQQLGAVPIVCRAGLENRARLVRETLGTGLFQLSAAVANDRYVLTRRAGRDASPDAPHTIVLRVIANQTTAANLLLAGELDAANVSGPDRERLEAAGFHAFSRRGPAVQMWFNQAPGRELANQGLRRAMAMGVDTQAIARIVGGRWAIAPVRLVGAEPLTCRTNTVAGSTPPFDPEAARALLDEMGWRTGRDGIRARDGRRLSLSLVYDRELVDPVAVDAAVELAVMQWRDIGVEVRARTITGAGIGDTLFTTSDFDISWVPIIVSLPSRLLTFTHGPKPPRGTNFPNLDFPLVDDLRERANAHVGAASCPEWDAIERVYLDSFSVVPVVDADNAIYSRRASFETAGLTIVPQTIRLSAPSQ